ncbi:MAG: hypothetical protein AABY11_01545 [archaeon]
MPPRDLKAKEEILRALLRKIDSDVDLFSKRLDTLHGKHDALTDAVIDAGLQPVPIRFLAQGKNTDILLEIENHILELNKLKNLIGMKLQRLMQEEELLAHLHGTYGDSVSFSRNTKGGIELSVKDLDADVAFAEVVESKKKLDALRSQIQEIGSLE